MYGPAASYCPSLPGKKKAVPRELHLSVKNGPLGRAVLWRSSVGVVYFSCTLEMEDAMHNRMRTYHFMITPDRRGL
jgi:hypothetical protein